MTVAHYVDRLVQYLMGKGSKIGNPNPGHYTPITDPELKEIIDGFKYAINEQIDRRVETRIEERLRRLKP